MSELTIPFKIIKIRNGTLFLCPSMNSPLCYNNHCPSFLAFSI